MKGYFIEGRSIQNNYVTRYSASALPEKAEDLIHHGSIYPRCANDPVDIKMRFFHKDSQYIIVEYIDVYDNIVALAFPEGSINIPNKHNGLIKYL